MSFAPVGVFCLMGSYVMAKGLNVFGDLAQYVALLIFVLAFHLFFTLFFITKVFANLNPLIFYRKMKDVALLRPLNIFKCSDYSGYFKNCDR